MPHAIATSHMKMKISQEIRNRNHKHETRHTRGGETHTSFWDAPATAMRTCLQDKNKTFSHSERHFGSKIKFIVLGMKLPNSRSFAIIGEENKRGLALEDNTRVAVCLYMCNRRGI